MPRLSAVGISGLQAGEGVKKARPATAGGLLLILAKGAGRTFAPAMVVKLPGILSVFCTQNQYHSHKRRLHPIRGSRLAQLAGAMQYSGAVLCEDNRQEQKGGES